MLTVKSVLIMFSTINIVRRFSKSSSRLAITSWINKNKTIWTSDGVVKSPFDDVDIPNVTLVEHIWSNLDKWPTKTASVCGITGKGYTYEEMYDLSTTFGSNLRKKFKVRDGDVVAIILPNIPEYPLAFFGVLSAGGVITTINPIYTAYEIYKQFVLSNPVLAITSPSTVVTVKEAMKLWKKELPTIIVQTSNEGVTPGTIDFHEISEDVHVDKSILNEVHRTADDVCTLPYSSGTTGLPKGVQITNKNIVSNICQQSVEELAKCRSTTLTHQDNVIGLLPLFHMFGLSVVMLDKLYRGLKMVTLSNFQPKTYLDTLLNYKINVMYAAPPTLLFLGNHPDVRKEHLDNVYSLISGAAPLPIADLHKIFEKAQRKIDFCQGYGLTETSPLATISPRGLENYTSVGWSLPNIDMKIVNNENQVLGPNQVGELLIRGPNIMKGYKGNEKANKEVFTEDNFFRTGDCAKIDESGQVTIIERLKELIKVKGFQVPPAELESILKEHPKILDAAVIGVKDDKHGEVPKAFVVLNDGDKCEQKEILEFVSERVAPFKMIKEVQYLDSIPKNPSGKILRRVLRDIK